MGIRDRRSSLPAEATLLSDLRTAIARSEHDRVSQLILDFDRVSDHTARIYVASGRIALYYDEGAVLSSTVRLAADRIECVHADGTAVIEKDQGGRVTNVAIPRTTEPPRPRPLSKDAPADVGPSTWYRQLLEDDEHET